VSTFGDGEAAAGVNEGLDFESVSAMASL
jgi:hypothetical protein